MPDARGDAQIMHERLAAVFLQEISIYALR